jgi:hypothetical protein
MGYFHLPFSLFQNSPPLFKEYKEIPWHCSKEPNLLIQRSIGFLRPVVLGMGRSPGAWPGHWCFSHLTIRSFLAFFWIQASHSAFVYKTLKLILIVSLPFDCEGKLELVREGRCEDPSLRTYFTF